MVAEFRSAVGPRGYALATSRRVHAAINIGRVETFTAAQVSASLRRLHREGRVAMMRRLESGPLRWTVAEDVAPDASGRRTGYLPW